MITVNVGPQRVKYHLYLGPLSYHAEYFLNALKAPWKESEDRAIDLDDIETETCKSQKPF